MRFYCLLCLAFAVFLSSGDAISTSSTKDTSNYVKMPLSNLVQARNAAQTQINPRRFLRAQSSKGDTTLSDEEERGISDVVKKTRTWIANSGRQSKVDYDIEKTVKATDLHLRGMADLPTLYGNKITPEHLFNALHLEKQVKLANQLQGAAYTKAWYWLQRNPKYKLWAEYNTFWTLKANTPL